MRVILFGAERLSLSPNTDIFSLEYARRDINVEATTQAVFIDFETYIFRQITRTSRNKQEQTRRRRVSTVMGTLRQDLNSAGSKASVVEIPGFIPRSRLAEETSGDS